MCSFGSLPNATSLVERLWIGLRCIFLYFGVLSVREMPGLVRAPWRDLSARSP